MREIFWQAFTEAEEDGEATVVTIASILYQRWRDDIEELTDLVMIINHKSWDHYRNGNAKYQEVYTELYYKYYEKALDYLEKEGREDDLRYFIRTLD